MSKGPDFSRRKFLTTSSILAGAAALCGAGISLTTAEAQTIPAMADHSAPAASGKTYRGMMFFTNSLYFDVLSEAAERIFPKDDLGPGAKDLAVPYFIDNQLAGAYGYNAREYIMGPHFEGASTQGYQTPLLRRDIFQTGLEALNKEAQDRYKDDFPTLTGDRMDLILKACEADKLKIDGVSSAYFFALLKAAVMAGAYADPIYNGNNDMNGWKMKEYPGAQMSYIGVVDSDEFQVIDPMSLADM